MVVCLDLETTGLDPKTDRIIEIAAVRFDEHAELRGAEIEIFETLVNPGIPLSDTIKLLTGITDKELAAAPTIEKVIPKLREFVGGSPVLGHNIPFDLGFLKHAGLEFPGIIYDTYDLVRVLTPSEASYSLDVLAQKWELAEGQAHRALVDAKVTVKLWNKLISEIGGRMNALTPETLEKFNTLFQKSNWPYSTFFRKDGGKMPKKSVDKLSRFSTDQTRHPLPDDIAKKWLSGEKILYETDRIFSAEKDTSRKIFVVSPYAEEPSLHEPDHYFSEGNFDLFLNEKQHFSNEETSFLARLLLWKEHTKTGLRHELAFRGEEWSLWSLISGEGNFWQHAVTAAKKGNVIYGPSAMLVSPDLKPFCEKDFLIIEEALHLEDRLTFALQEQYALYHFDVLFRVLEGLADGNMKLEIKKRKNSLELLYGFLGMYFQKNTDPIYQNDVIIDGSFASSTEGKRVLSSVIQYQNLIEDWPKNTSPLYTHVSYILIEKLKKLLKILLEKQMNTAKWISMYRETVTIYSAPIDIAPHVKDVFENAAGILMCDPALNEKDDTAFIRTTLGLNGSWKFEKDPGMNLEKIDMTVPENLPAPNSEGYFEKSAEIIQETLQDYPGQVLIICQTQRALESHYQKLIPFATSKKITLLANKITGGQGKVVSQFLQNPQNSVLMGNQAMIRDLEKLAPSLRCIIFQKLPFDFAMSPLQKLRPLRFKNSYQEYTLPRAMLRFRHFLFRWQGFPGEKKLILLDTRFRI